MINVDISNIWGDLALPELLAIEQEVAAAHLKLVDRLPITATRAELARIQAAGEAIRRQSQVCVVLGVDGSAMGAQGVIELLQGPNRNLTDPGLTMHFTGTSLNLQQWRELTALLEGKTFSVIVVAESGFAPETALALRGLKWMLERKLGTDACSRRIFAVTREDESELGQLARERGWETFLLPAELPRGFGVLTAAGLLPMAAAGIDVEALLRGAQEGKEDCALHSFENPVWLYAAVRNLFCRRGKTGEVFASWEPGSRMLTAWWQQLFSNAEGSCQQALIPVPAQFSADLYTLGQLLQGRTGLFETMVRFEPTPHTASPESLGFLEGSAPDRAEAYVYESTLAAHVDSGVPVVVMECGPLQELTLGQLLYFLELACGVCAGTMGADLFPLPREEEQD